MIYEVTPAPDLMEILKLSNELEDERTAARASIQQEIRDRHAAALLVISRYGHAVNSPAWDLLHRTVTKLEKYSDDLFTVLEVL